MASSLLKNVRMFAFVLLLILFMLTPTCAANKSNQPPSAQTNAPDTTPQEWVQTSESNQPPSTQTNAPGELPKEWVQTPYSKESVSDVIAILNAKSTENEPLPTDFYDAIYNVTPKLVAQFTDIRIFKFANTGQTFALIDGELYTICNYFGGHGMHNAVPWDYDEDGTVDLLIASSWGSGIHRDELSVYNVKTKESIPICSTLEAEYRQLGDNWVLTPDYPPSTTHEINELPTTYYVCSADINDNWDSERGAMGRLDYAVTSLVGTVTSENGTPVFYGA